jgi:CBS domain-containing protein
MDSKNTCTQCPIDISEEDILEAMTSIDGYVDITPADFMEIYKVSYQHAVERLSRAVRAKDVMTRTVIHTQPYTPLLDAAILMAERNITGLPVVDPSGQVLGVLSEKDFLREMGIGKDPSFMSIVSLCLKNKGCMVVSPNHRHVRDIMTSPAVTVFEETSVYEIATVFNEKKINRVPVLDKESRLCGIVTRSDIVLSYCAKTF